MKSKTLVITTTILCIMAIIAACGEANDETEKKKDDIITIRKKEKDELIDRGKYLVTVALCHDCHSPKIMTPQGPVLDSSRLLSGFPAENGIPSLTEELAKDHDWVKMSQDVTAFAGPWGMSFAANLTPDSATGIGNWTEEVFMKTLRTGKHLGQEGGRPVMPPMPWEMVSKMTDEDLSAIYNYLKSLPAISNRVPAPIPPNEMKITKQ